MSTQEEGLDFLRDFTFQMYSMLCQKIQAKYATTTVLDYLKRQPDDVAIIRHDVDKKPKNALSMANLEASLGIQSTYYFRTVPDSFDKEVIGKIEDLGHEIGYHYEVLDTVGGNYEEAISLFADNLTRFPCEIKTICMHGNPLTPWDNRDLWSRYDFKKYGIAGEAYLSLDFSRITYFSDTGRAWHDRYSIKDYTANPPPKTASIANTPDLIRHIPSLQGPVCVVTHPQRWNDAIVPWTVELAGQTTRNIGKMGIRFFGRRKTHAATR